jgi:hypothetical protein
MLFLLKNVLRPPLTMYCMCIRSLRRVKEYFEEEKYVNLCKVLEHGSIYILFLKTMSTPPLGVWKTLQYGKKRSAYTEQTLSDAI